ncbi:MAG: hypothetical protein ABMA25_24580 [Ilumatobacteraceae bacterium]
MSEFHDPDFENLLGRSGGPMPDVNIAYQRVQGRVRQVKRRRAIVASSAACVVLFGAAVFASARNPGTDTVSPADRGSDVSNSTDDSLGGSTSLATDSTLTSTTLVTDSTVPTETSVVGGGGVTPTQPGGSQPGNTTPSNTTPGATNPPSSSTPATNPPATNPPATNPPAPVDKTFSSEGGSITVRLQNGSLTLLATNPASGYTPETRKNGGTRVEVRFDNGTDTIDIRIDLINGEMVQR